MRRCAPLVLAGALAFAACSGDDGASPPRPEDGFTVLSPPAVSSPPTADRPTTPDGEDGSSSSPPAVSSPPASDRPTTPDGGDGSSSSPPAADRPPPGEGDGSSSSPPSPTPESVAVPTELPTIALSFVEVARLEAPTAVRTRVGSTSLYVAERAGRVRELSRDGLVPDDTPVLDISDEVSTTGERGFFGFDFSTDGTLVWTMHNDLAGNSVVTEWMLGDDGLVDRSSRRELLRVDQPFSNHNGGDLHLGPDGHLYIGLGDGGGNGDSSRNGQNPTTLLGALLRIDPTPDDDRAYSIPPDNPFVAGGGAPQVWSYGLRNPWRFSFDPATDDLWIGDVGQNLFEEIDLLPADDGAGRGANLGWNDIEGNRPFAADAAPADHVAPVLVYDHSAGRCSVTGGFVYRGTAIPALDGVYVFGDLCDGIVRGFVPGIGVAPLNLPSLGASLISFGLDADGELLTLGGDGRIHRIVAD